MGYHLPLTCYGPNAKWSWIDVFLCKIQWGVFFQIYRCYIVLLNSNEVFRMVILWYASNFDINFVIFQIDVSVWRCHLRVMPIGLLHRWSLFQIMLQHPYMTPEYNTNQLLTGDKLSVMHECWREDNLILQPSVPEPYCWGCAWSKLDWKNVSFDRFVFYIFAQLSLWNYF